MVLAALLHDVGHLIQTMGENPAAAGRGGARQLSEILFALRISALAADCLGFPPIFLVNELLPLRFAGKF